MVSSAGEKNKKPINFIQPQNNYPSLLFKYLRLK
jgi:hypothetical protein